MADTKLRDVQSWFWRSIAGEPGEYEFEPDLVALVEPSRTQEPAQRVEVYADAYFLRLRDILSEDFPRVATLLGHEAFANLVRGYLKAHPSTDPSVRHLGRALSAFIRSRSDLPSWLADLAALEWARINAFDAPDDDALLDSAKLAQLDPGIWPQQKLIPVRSLETLDAAWPVHRIWADEDGPEQMALLATSLRVWRGKDFYVFHAPMDARESSAMSRLLAGASFAEICQVFEDLDEQQAAQEAGALLLRWLEDGIIARIE
jgi:hypothetical protein